MPHKSREREREQESAVLGHGGLEISGTLVLASRGSDVMVTAQTGSGKTAAFLVCWLHLLGMVRVSSILLLAHGVE